MKSSTLVCHRFLLCCLAIASTLSAQVPQLINYQGRVTIAGVNFDGVGQFRFALVNATATTTYWRNSPDTTPADGVPDAAVVLTVSRGLYAVQLGDTTLAGMNALPNTVFSNPDVRLRIWFNDGAHGTQLLSPDQRFAAVGYAMMADNVADGAITSAKIAAGAVGSAQLANGAVGNLQLADHAVSANNLAPGAALANLSADNQSGVPSGGVVMSATDPNAVLMAAGYAKIGATSTSDLWEQRSDLNAPSTRENYSSVWTGTELIIWGGNYLGGILNTGARYNPATRIWTPMTVVGAPSSRIGHTVVWTGSRMIIWGGRSSLQDLTYENSGASYDPVTDSWTLLNLVGAPTARNSHASVWTGVEMLVWGGRDATGQTATGRRYNPATNSWSALSNTGAPSARNNHTAVWTGSKMIIWGGWSDAEGELATGGVYDPVQNTWQATSTQNAPLGRKWHTAVWTGSEMIIWGGSNANVQPGVDNVARRYTPGGDSWDVPGSSGESNPPPSVRPQHSATWTGTEMIIWGGSGWHIDGARYNPSANYWTPMTIVGAPTNSHTTVVWTGSELLAWVGGNFNQEHQTHSYTLGRTLYLYQRP